MEQKIHQDVKYLYKEKLINNKKPKNTTKMSKNQTKTNKNQSKITKTDKNQQKSKNENTVHKSQFRVHNHLKYTPWIHQENIVGIITTQ